MTGICVRFWRVMSKNLLDRSESECPDSSLVLYDIALHSIFRKPNDLSEVQDKLLCTTYHSSQWLMY